MNGLYFMRLNLWRKQLEHQTLYKFRMLQLYRIFDCNQSERPIIVQPLTLSGDVSLEHFNSGCG